MEATRTAYRRRGSYEGRTPTYDELRQAANEFIVASYEYQRVVYGRIKVKLSVANLLR